MKYNLQPQQALINNEGITTTEGWALIYNIDPQTEEYKNATYEYLPAGVSLPAHAYLDSPKSVDDEHAIIRGDIGWLYPSDHRGETIYSTKTGAESTMNEIGDIPDNYTLLAPTSNFDSWNGEEWVLDTEKQHQFYVEQASTEKAQLISEATSTIAYLQDAVDAEIATEEEQKALAEWKKYRVLLNRIDTNNVPDVNWPTKP